MSCNGDVRVPVTIKAQHIEVVRSKAYGIAGIKVFWEVPYLHGKNLVDKGLL